MDPPSNPTGPPSLVFLCEAIIQTLERCHRSSDKASERSETLRHEIETLRRFFALLDRIRWAQPPRVVFEEDQWEKLRILTDRCRSTLSNLHKLLSEQEPKVTVFARPNKAGQRRQSLQLPSEFHQWRQQFPQHDFQTRLQNLSNAIGELRKTLGQRKGLVYNEPQIDEVEEAALMQKVESCLTSAENIMHNTRTAIFEETETSWPLMLHGPINSLTQKSISQMNQTSNSPRLEVPSKDPLIPDLFEDSNAKHQGSTDSDPDSDPEPDFEERFPPAVYSELITTLLQESHKEMQAGNYRKAELTHCKAMKYLTDREAKLNIPFESRIQMYETLADIYVKQKRFDKAKAILSSLLKQENSETDRKWRLYHTLAGICLAQDRLVDAEKFAKRAYIGREKALGKGHALIAQSADLLVLIYKKQGETQAAQAFRNLYPNEKIVAQAPQASKHVGTKRVAWNPDLSVDFNAITKSGKTLLINAISSGDDRLVENILESGADVEARCDGGISPLMYAVIHGQKMIAGLLLSRGAQANATTSGWTVLHKAIDLADWNMAQLLLENGADIEARGSKRFASNKGGSARRDSKDIDSADEDADSDDEKGWTCLLRAADCGKEPMVRLLLDHGADIEAQNSSNGTPLSCAAENQHEAVVDLLLIRGANANTEDEFGWRPLHRTQVRHGGDEIALRLLNNEADVNAKCVKGKTPLHYAVERDNESMVYLLLKADADIGATDIVKRTPLHTAIESRLENMVHLLLEFGADASAKDCAGHDGLAAANHALRKSPEILKLLSKHMKAKKKEGAALASSEKTQRVSSTPSSSSVSTGPAPTQASTLARTSSSWWSRRSKKLNEFRETRRLHG
ncbi:MAG: hypothetical protein Q9217_001921 [Psora testacea]